MVARRSLVLILTFAAGALAQQCQPSTGILKLVGVDPGCASSGSAVQECTSKMQLSVSQACMVELQPDLPVAADGTFCSPSRAVQQRDLVGGKLVLGRSDVEFMMRPHAASGAVIMSLKGRIVPPAGGREYPLDNCNLMFNVTGGSALGIVSSGRDSLMSTTVQGFNPAVAGGGYSGAVLSGQQQGMNGMTGPRAESGKDAKDVKKSSAGAASNGRVMAALAGVAGLVLPLLV